MPKKQMPALLSAADMASSLFIDLPEMQPNSANKFFDSLASSTPIMLNYGGWMHELVEGKKCGLAMWRKPVSEVARIVSSRITDRQWLETAGAAARSLAESEFDRDRLAVQFAEVITKSAIGQGQSAEHIAPGRY